ncbi:hypothetical protein [Caldimonas tepidiphila]|uniref:hypothetical protein n=1 Tax=Caldimonas tepidiphila TaxID=2315841 RepID=UPI001300659A|nr:hypothetical protein [Caldimonas tepidiphila]
MGGRRGLSWILVLAGTLGLRLFGALRGGKRPPAVAVCSICGHCGPPRRHLPGSARVERLLWLPLLLPGLLYRLWRLSGSRRVCAACGAAHLVPPDSELGQRLSRGRTPR